MNKQTKYPLILSLAYKFVSVIYPLALLYWKIGRPETTGVKVILKNQDEILLVINTYGSRKWSLPGGGVLKGESLLGAAKRETFEEVGIEAVDLVSHGSFFFDGLGKKDTIWVYSTEVKSRNFHLQSEEISDARWFPLSHLPKISSIVLSESLKLAGLDKSVSLRSTKH